MMFKLWFWKNHGRLSSFMMLFFWYSMFKLSKRSSDLDFIQYIIARFSFLLGFVKYINVEL